MSRDLGQDDQIIGNIEARRAAIADAIKVYLACVKRSRVYRPALGEENQAVKEGDNVGSRLVNGEDDGSLVSLGQGHETFDDIVGIEGIQATGGLVEEED